MNWVMAMSALLIQPGILYMICRLSPGRPGVAARIGVGGFLLCEIVLWATIWHVWWAILLHIAGFGIVLWLSRKRLVLWRSLRNLRSSVPKGELPCMRIETARTLVNNLCRHFSMPAGFRFG